MSKELPKAIKEVKSEVESVFLRTVIKQDIYDRLKLLAKEYSTGQGNWDFGVAIQVLLDQYDSSQQQLQSEKLDMILSIVSTQEQQSEKPKEEEFIEMLGGSKIKKNGE